MEKKDITKLNRSNKDIWALIDQGLKTKNFAILEKNLKRIYLLQCYYIKLLNFQDHEIRELHNELISEISLSNSFEGVAKRTGNYDLLKKRIDELFRDS